MRRIGLMIGGIAVAGLLAVAMAQPASAAEGVLYIDGDALANPTGCFVIPDGGAYVENDTDQDADVIDDPYCDGPTLGTIYGGGDGASVDAGLSIWIP